MGYSVNQIPLGMMQANCYIVTEAKTGEALVVDPGAYTEDFAEKIRSLNISKLRYILLTHGHFDHIAGAMKLKEQFSGEIVIHELDEPYLTDSEKNLSYLLPEPLGTISADRTVRDGDVLPFGSGKIEVIHTPGHTPGGVCYLLDSCLFTGDTLMCRTIGRMDFPGGNVKQMIASIRRLASLPDTLVIYPGHDCTGTLGSEKKYNPYLKEF